MLKRLLILPLVALIATAPLAAHSAEEKKDEKDKKAKDGGQYVDLQPVAIPIVVDGRMVNYVFVYVRVTLKPSADVGKVRDKEPAFRAALVRDAHRTPFVKPDDWQKVDDKALIATMTREVNALAPGVAASVTITQQTPQKHVMPPRPAQPDKPSNP